MAGWLNKVSHWVSHLWGNKKHSGNFYLNAMTCTLFQIMWLSIII